LCDPDQILALKNMRDCLFLYWRWHSITLFSNCLQKRLYELKILERHLFLSPIVIPAAGDKGFFLTMWTMGASLLTPVILEFPMLVAIWTTGLASTITFGSGAIKYNTWMDGNYDWSSQIFKSGAFASLNESVEAVATALNNLLIEATLVISGVRPPDSASRRYRHHHILCAQTALIDE
jgi:hypothetical protein